MARLPGTDVGDSYIFTQVIQCLIPPPSVLHRFSTDGAYTVAVHTADAMFAGTDSNVKVELMG